MMCVSCCCTWPLLKKPFENFLLVFVFFLIASNIILTEETQLLFDTGLVSVCTCEHQPTIDSRGAKSLKNLFRKNCL